MKSFEERLRAIEAMLRRKPGAATFQILEISGGLPGPVNFATAGGVTFDRGDEEPLEAFVERAAQEAFRNGIMRLVVGGLPTDQTAVAQKYTDADGNFRFDDWWREIGGVDYPEVPPPEAPGYHRPSSPVSSLLDRDRPL
jgi:hypothetical protein